MNHEKPSGPMHEVIRKALEELKLHGNPYGCIHIVTNAISSSNCDSRYAYYLKRAKEEEIGRLLPQHLSCSTRGPHARKATEAAAHSVPTTAVVGEVLRGTSLSPTSSAASPPLSPSFSAGGGRHGTTLSPTAGGKTGLLQGLLVSGGAGSVGGTTTTTTVVQGSKARSGETAEKNDPTGDSAVNGEDGSNGASGGGSEKKHTFNAIQLLRLILIRCDAFSQTKQHEKAIVDAKVAILISKGESPEAYFCCGREERKLYHIGESVQCFEAGIHVLRCMKQRVMQSLRTQLLSQGYCEDGTLLVDDETVRGKSGGGDDLVGGAVSSSSPVAANFLYEAFYYPDRYVKALEGHPQRKEGKGGIGATQQPDSDEEEERDYWAQRGYRLEDVRRLGLDRKQEEQREVDRLRAFQSQLHRRRRTSHTAAAYEAYQQGNDGKDGGSGGAGHSSKGSAPTLRLDPVILDSRSNSRGDLCSLQEQYEASSGYEDEDEDEDEAGDEGGDEAGAETGSDREAALHNGSGRVKTTSEAGVDTGNPQLYSVTPPAAGSSVVSDTVSRLTTDSTNQAVILESGNRNATDPGDAPREGDDERDEVVFSFFPELRTRGVAERGRRQFFLRNSDDMEQLFALNHYGMLPTELSVWLRLYKESRALKRMGRKKTFPVSVFGTTLYLLSRRLSSVRNSVAIVVENALLERLASPPVAGDGRDGKDGRAWWSRGSSLLEFVGCTAPDAQYTGNHCFPLVVRPGEAGFALLQPKGWGGYSGCVCYALQVGPSDGPNTREEHLSFFIYCECSMMGAVKCGVRCVRGIKVDDLRSAFYEVNSGRAGVHGIAGAVEEKVDSAEGGGGGGGRQPASLERPRLETAAQRAGRLAALKAVRMPPPSSWLTSQTLLLQHPHTERGAAANPNTGRASALAERRIKVSTNSSISSCEGSGTAVGNSSILTISISEHLPVRLKSVELIPALEFAGPAVLKKASALSRRYRELVNGFPPPSFFVPSAGGGARGGNGSLASALYYSAVSIPRNSFSSYYPDYCLYGDRFSSPWVIRGKAVVVFKLFFIGRVVDQEEFVVAYVDSQTADTGGIHVGLPRSTSSNAVTGDSASGQASSRASATGGPMNRSAVLSDADATTNGSNAVSPRVAMGYHNADSRSSPSRRGAMGGGAGGGGNSSNGSGGGGNSILLHFSADSQTRHNAQVYYADHRCLLFHIKESWIPFSSAVYLQSAALGARTFGSVQSSNTGSVYTLSLATAPKPVEGPHPHSQKRHSHPRQGSEEGLGAFMTAGSDGVGVGSGGHAGVIPSGSGVGGGGFGGSMHAHTSGSAAVGGGASAAATGGGKSSDHDNVLYTVRKRLPPPSSSPKSGGGSSATTTTGSVVHGSSVSPATGGASLLDGVAVASGTVVRGAGGSVGGAAAASGGLAKDTLQGRVSSLQSLTQLEGSVLHPPPHPHHSQTANGGSSNTPRQAYMQHQQAHVAQRSAAGDSNSSPSAGDGAAGPLSRAEQFCVWRSSPYGGGAEIMAEIRVLCSPYPLFKGMLLGEVRLLPGADALLVSTLLFILSRS